MVNRTSAPSASSALRSSVVLSRAVEKTLALEAEVSRLWHHVSVLSRRLHRAEKKNAALVGSLREPTLPTVIPSSPAVSVVTVLGGGLDPESPRIFGWPAEGVAREDVAPFVPPSSPPFVEGLGVGGLVPDFDLGWEEAPPSEVAGVAPSVAVSVAVAPSSEEVPEPVADGEGASSGATGVAAGDDSGWSTVGLPGSAPGKRRKNKKRRVRYDVTDPVPLVSSSSESSSSWPVRARARPAPPPLHPAMVEGTAEWWEGRCRTCRAHVPTWGRHMPDCTSPDVRYFGFRSFAAVDFTVSRSARWG